MLRLCSDDGEGLMLHSVYTLPRITYLDGVAFLHCNPTKATLRRACWLRVFSLGAFGFLGYATFHLINIHVCLRGDPIWHSVYWAKVTTKARESCYP